MLGRSSPPGNKEHDEIILLSNFCWKWNRIEDLIGNERSKDTTDSSNRGARTNNRTSDSRWEQFGRVQIEATKRECNEQFTDKSQTYSVYGRICKTVINYAN